MVKSDMFSQDFMMCVFIVNDILMDMEHWKSWDRRLPSAKVLEVKKHSRVIYWYGEEIQPYVV